MGTAQVQISLEALRDFLGWPEDVKINSIEQGRVGRITGRCSIVVEGDTLPARAEGAEPAVVDAEYGRTPEDEPLFIGFSSWSA